jgi:hypothetical protein
MEPPEMVVELLKETRTVRLRLVKTGIAIDLDVASAYRLANDIVTGLHQLGQLRATIG